MGVSLHNACTTFTSSLNTDILLCWRMKSWNGPFLWILTPKFFMTTVWEKKAASIMRQNTVKECKQQQQTHY